MYILTFDERYLIIDGLLPVRVMSMLFNVLTEHDNRHDDPDCGAHC